MLNIISHKVKPIKFLRSGKAIQFEKLFLTKIQGLDKPKYLNKNELIKLKDGEYHLRKYNGI